MNLRDGIRLKLWQLVLPGLVLANVAYFFHNFVGWILTLGFFLVVPGYLTLRLLKIKPLVHGEVFSLSLGLSLSILIIGGLTLNSLKAFGLDRPLSTLPIFIFFDVVTLFLVLLVGMNTVQYRIRKKRFSVLQIIVFIVLTFLPLIAAGGAIRLNNGASNILILLLMSIIGALFIFLPARKNLQFLYPYAAFTIGLSILFCNSLRGSFITGHDIHHEFGVFYQTLQNGHWQIIKGGDPYNACLSITILPVIFAKLTSISIIMVYKLYFQVLFALFLPALYFIFRKFATPRIAMLGTFVFMTFPTFTNDLPFLNRQEIAFIFVILLILTNFLQIRFRSKIFLTTIFIVSIILSHYSSSYVTLLLLLLAPIFYAVLGYKSPSGSNPRYPLMNVRIILVSLLLTFTWNAQITNSTGNLRNTVVNTFINVFGPAEDRQQFNYSLTQAPTSSKPQQLYQSYAAKDPNQIQLVQKDQLPITGLGHLVGKVTHVHNAQLANQIFHALLAKVLQLLVVAGTLMMIFKKRHRRNKQTRYLLALACASLFVLALFTVLPQLAVDYDVTRLFQQSLIFLWLPSILFAELLFFYLGRLRFLGAAAVFAFLYLNLTGFIPQLTGGFPPQLPLNNSGIYYIYFYGHGSDVVGTAWLGKNKDNTKDVKFDTGAVVPIIDYRYGVGFIDKKNAGYIYKDHADVQRGTYRLIIEGAFIEYKYPAATADRNEIYSNGGSEIYLKD